MAVIKTETVDTLGLRVATGTSSGGKTTYSTRNFGNINPEGGDTALFNAGVGLAGLQTHSLGQVRRTSVSVLVEE